MIKAFKRLDTVDKVLLIGFILILAIARYNGVTLGGI